jgi:hypothetical protein
MAALFFCLKITCFLRYIIMNATVTVPNLSEITLEQYQRFLKVQQINKEDEYILQLKMIEIFCNVDFKDARLIKFKDVEKIIEKLTKTFQEKPNLIKTFKMDGVEYGFIPNLQDISFGEYIDIDTYLPQEDQTHLAMNVLYRPVKNKKAGKYSIEDYDINAKDRMKEMPLSVMLSAAFFLQNLGMELLNVTSNYLQEEMKKQQVSQQGLEKNGDGIQASMHSLKEILNDLKISLPLN